MRTGETTQQACNSRIHPRKQQDAWFRSADTSRGDRTNIHFHLKHPDMGPPTVHCALHCWPARQQRSQRANPVDLFAATVGPPDLAQYHLACAANMALGFRCRDILLRNRDWHANPTRLDRGAQRAVCTSQRRMDHHDRDDDRVCRRVCERVSQRHDARPYPNSRVPHRLRRDQLSRLRPISGPRLHNPAHACQSILISPFHEHARMPLSRQDGAV